jgi:hypothetical protein
MKNFDKLFNDKIIMYKEANNPMIGSGPSAVKPAGSETMPPQAGIQKPTMAPKPAATTIQLDQKQFPQIQKFFQDNPDAYQQFNLYMQQNAQTQA